MNKNTNRTDILHHGSIDALLDNVTNKDNFNHEVFIFDDINGVKLSDNPIILDMPVFAVCLQGEATVKLNLKNYPVSANSLVTKLAQDNNIQNVNLIYVGQKLVIKDNGEIKPATAQDVAANATTPAQATANTANSSYTSSVAGNDAAAKAWIAARESGGNYNARNGQYIGKYQLSAAYLNGDYSAANQERVADQYVASRYGSWSAAQAFWQANGWY